VSDHEIAIERGRAAVLANHGEQPLPAAEADLEHLIVDTILDVLTFALDAGLEVDYLWARIASNTDLISQEAS
jgi:hypothetical protein